MNLAFVIDKSGSMAADNKLDWVKESFRIFIDKVRDKDFVSLIIFNHDAEVIYKSTRMDSQAKRMQFRQQVESIEPGGGTNLSAGLQLGYQEVLANFRKDYSNRVLFLTDGVGDSAGILEMAAGYRDMDIHVSTIGLGNNFDLKLMTDLAHQGGGSSRFISDREEMEETFGSELDRMVVPAARDLKMKLELVQDAEILGTWGYENAMAGNTISYYLPTLHHRDYETILCQIRLPAVKLQGTAPLAIFTLEYKDLSGKTKLSGPHQLEVTFVEAADPVTGFSNAFVLRSGTMLHFAQALQEIAVAYYSTKEDIAQINDLRYRLWNSQAGNTTASEADYNGITNPEITILEKQVHDKFRFAFDKTLSIKKELANTGQRLDEAGFDDEIEICNRYLDILGKEMELEEGKLGAVKQDLEIRPVASEQQLSSRLTGFVREIALDMNSKPAGVLAVSGFTEKGSGSSNKLTGLLDEIALVEFKKLDHLSLAERDKLQLVIKEQQLALSDLMDTTTAIRIGRLLSAKYILTGSVIEMAGSVMVFGRIINVETAEIESVAQVILAKDKEIGELLTK